MTTEEAIERCHELIKESHSCWIGITNQEAIKIVLSMIEKKDKIIEQMTYYIMNLDIDEDVCKRVNCDTNSGELDCKDCIKQYFENKVKKEE